MGKYWKFPVSLKLADMSSTVLILRNLKKKTPIFLELLFLLAGHLDVCSSFVFVGSDFWVAA